MKIRKGTLLLGVVALVLLWIGMRETPQEKTVGLFTEDRAVLRQLAWQVLEEGSARGVPVPEGWQSVSLCTRGHTVVQFARKSSGFASQTSYCGVNYVPEDILVDFQGEHWDYWKPKGNGRLYYDPEGDNTCYVERIAPCWYFYEAKF